MVAEVKPLQLQNTLFPMEVTLSGMVIDFRFWQPIKASSPMEVTLAGMVMEVKPQPSKAQGPIVFTLLPRVTDFKL